MFEAFERELSRYAKTKSALRLPKKEPLPIAPIEKNVALHHAKNGDLGAVILTGLLGGAVASHLRVESPLFSHILSGIYLGLTMWGGLWLRDSRLQALFPFRTNAH